MKNIEVVFYQSGENRGTLSPKCELADFTGDLNEKTFRFISHDWDMKVEVNMYEVKTVSIPNNWDYKTWVANYIGYKYTVALCGEDAIEKLTDKQLNNLMQLGQYEQYTFGKLMSSTNEFLQSLCGQFLTWLEKDAQEKYRLPFSERQYSALAKFRIRPLDAKRISDSVYWS